MGIVRSSVAVTVRIACVGLGACGDNLPPDSGDLLSQFAVRNVATLSPSNDRGIALAAVDDKTVAVARATVNGDTFCPACIIDPTSLDCAAICTRTRIAVRVVHVGDMTGPTFTVANVFPRSVNHAVNSIDIDVLAGGRVGVAWLECDNSLCNGTLEKQTCDARYATIAIDIDPDMTQAPEIQTLYERRFGDLHIVSDLAGARVLAFRTKQPALGVGLDAAIFDDSGAVALQPWLSLGSVATRAATATATSDGFVIVADDRNPDPPEMTPPAPARAPCEMACDCLAGGGANEDKGGLFAFHLGGRQTSERIATGIGDDGRFAMREVIAVTEANNRLVVAAGQSIDRSAELFDSAGGSWKRRLTSPAPLPGWIGVLGDARHLAWLGSEQSTRTTESLVAGVIDGNVTAHGSLEMAVAGQVFDVAPVVTPTGVTRTFLLRGVRDTAQRIERFEVIEIRAPW